MPGNTCKICQHPKRKEIDLAIIQGETTRNIAKLYGPSNAAVFRHSRHLPKQLVKAVEVKEAVYRGRVVDRIEAIYRETAEDRERLRQEGNLELALRHTVELRKQLELQARIAGEMKDGGATVNMNGPVQVNVVYEKRAVIVANVEPTEAAIDV